MESIKELRKKCQKKGGSDYYIRKYSIYITRLFLYTNLTPNQITMIWVIVGVIGASLFIFGNYTYSIIGALLMFLAFSLDFVDGEVARYKKLTSGFGEFLDWVGTWFISLFAILTITLGSFLSSGSVWIIFVGGLLLLGYSMKELLPLKYLSTNKNKPEKGKKLPSKLYKAYLIGRKIMFVEYFFEAILICSILNQLPVFLIFYAIGFNTLWVIKVFAEFMKLKKGYS